MVLPSALRVGQDLEALVHTDFLFLLPLFHVVCYFLYLPWLLLLASVAPTMKTHEAIAAFLPAQNCLGSGLFCSWAIPSLHLDSVIMFCLFNQIHNTDQKKEFVGRLGTVVYPTGCHALPPNFSSFSGAVWATATS